MIEFIDNQTIKFTLESEITDCGCTGQPYCQPVRFTDETQFQVKGNIINSDPEFGNEYIGWETWDALELSLETTNITGVGLCDGTIDATASLGSGSGYTYSIDGGAFSGTNTFTGLCEGTYLIVAKDSDGHYASTYGYVGSYFNCSSLSGQYIDFVDTNYLNDLNNCYLNDAI